MLSLKLDVIQLAKDLDTKSQSGEIELHCITDAPLWLKLLFNGDYIAYKNIIYVPPDHLLLATSKNRQDKVVAVSKLLPWAAAILDGKTKLSDVLSFRFGWKLRSFYFCYEYVFLKLMESAYKDLILKGFLVTRKLFFVRVDYTKVLDFLNQILSTKQFFR